MSTYTLHRIGNPGPLSFEADRVGLNVRNGLFHFFKNGCELFVHPIREVTTLFENQKPVFEAGSLTAFDGTLINVIPLKNLASEINLMRQSVIGNELRSKITNTEVKRYNQFWNEVKTLQSSKQMPPAIDDKGGPIEIIYKDLISSLEKLGEIVDESLNKQG